MSRTHIPAALRRLVEERADGRCEYCLLPRAVAFFPHEVDHVVAKKHAGATVAENLALTCWRCNRHKGRTTANLLQYNTPERVAERRRLSDVGRYP